MATGFNINIIRGDGYLVLPISLSRLGAGQSPKEIYDIFHYFAKKLATFSNDVILLYTTGLYFNADNLTYEQRVKDNQKVIEHSTALRKLIQKRKKYMPNAFHFLPIDYVILNSSYYKEFFELLKKWEKTNKNFRDKIKQDMGDRDYSEANVNFILEEVAVSHIIRQRLIEFPRTLVKNDIWRLIAYPGDCIAADKYQWEHKILPQTDTLNPYSGAHYNFSKKKLTKFDDI